MEPTKVLPGLYLGDQRHVADEDVLLDHDITHVISVGKDYKVDIEDIEHLVLDVLDMEDQDISKYFDKTFTFIEKGRRDGAVLVHCNAGVSRSPTIVAAYLMKKLNCTLDDALGLIKDVKPDICPNDGFLRQLKRYYYTKLHPELAHQYHDEPKSSETEHTTVLSESKSVATQSQPEITEPNESDSPVQPPILNCKYYTCRVCGTLLFYETDIAKHEVAKHHFQYHKRDASQTTECTSLFIEYQSWMGDLSDLEGRLKCPKCAKVVGSWKWDGTQCSCGTWCTPALQIPKTRVDERLPVLSIVTERSEEDGVATSNVDTSISSQPSGTDN